MQNVVLTIHLILALLLTGVVLLQRSEGGGLGMGGSGGGGGGGVMSGRQAANVFTRLTWVFGIALFVTSIALTVIAAREASTGSIIDQLGGQAQSQEEAPASNLPNLGTYTPPPTTSGQPVTPPSPQAPASAPAETAPATTAPETTAPEAAAPAADAVTPPAAETPAEPAQPATN
ncbi:preprotein translocase subunit SecG [Paracoccus tegillarcae]|uniref:Protein-export membrane protein SecG n=1 Tax=Paracoccus tegillarcae TaxID=1529068 RepID=A0A2K9F4R2_9RHOB|nr:preprotein translocase subunit SecG [Paracoccus tegillarcae]AUH35392.1 preprotein translocase subunit SecG [Paracoccus tegillarcae]